MVVYDTGSGWLTVTSASCTNCRSNIYNATASTTAVQEDTLEFTLSYGSATLKGYKYLDTACVADNACAEGFEF